MKKTRFTSAILPKLAQVKVKGGVHIWKKFKFGIWFSLILLLVATMIASGSNVAGPAVKPVQQLLGPADTQVAVTLTVSEPDNGTHFVAGEQPVVTVNLYDEFATPLALDDFSTLSLYMYGPQETTKTKTAVALLNAETDRSVRPHHYIDLLTNTDVQVNGNVLAYQLQPITDEEPGTYTVGLWVVAKWSGLVRSFELVDIQIGTATVEKQIVEAEKCAACHLGAASGKFYLHHVDPGRSPTGSWALDSVPVRTCKSCHNTDGYAAYRDASVEGDRVPDPIVRRVHGVHMGEHLESAFNIDPVSGDFGDYLHVEFPANVRNCTYCHVDDRWKTEPSRLACGACHDNIWFGDRADMPATAEAHPGRALTDDTKCAGCHTPDDDDPESVARAHKVEPYAFQHSVELSMTPPENGQYYVAGEAPQVTIVLKDTATDEIIDPATIVEPKDPENVAENEWRRANLFVSGPRSKTVPVLTTAAEHADPSHYYANNDFRVLTDPANEDPRISRTDTSIVYQLDDVADLKPGTYTAFVETMPAVPLGGWQVLNFQVGTEEPEPMVATNCTACHGNTGQHAGYFAVDFKPDICKSCHDYVRQIDGASGWTDRNNGYGAAPLSRRVHGVHFGRYLDKPGEVHAEHDYSEVIFPQDVRNCIKCHSESQTWTQKPSRLACLACHDTDPAIVHAKLMTEDPTPGEPYNGDEQETCVVCHGPDREFTPEKMHNIWDPYKPPYPREPGE